MSFSADSFSAKPASENLTLGIDGAPSHATDWQQHSVGGSWQVVETRAFADIIEGQ